MEDARREGGLWFCSTSCLLQGSPGKWKNTKQRSGPVRALRRLLKRTLLVFGVLVVVGTVGAVLVNHSNNVTDASGAPVESNIPASNGVSLHHRSALKAKVIVAADGFTQSRYTTSTQPYFSYGVALHNRTKADALDVGVTVSFVDSLGRSVASDKTTLTGIPAGRNFYVGGLASSNVSLTVASMKVSVTVGSTQPRRLKLPPVSGLGVQTDSLSDGNVRGTFENPYTKPIPSTGEIYVVYLDAQGKVVGGASEFTGASVNPRASVAFGFSSFESDIGPSFVRASQVATIDGSVDPCGGIILGASCPAQVPAQST